MSDPRPASSPAPVNPAQIRQVILASAVGTMIEWYDFHIFGSLAAILSPQFYPKGNDTLALIAYLSTFAVGFVVRPFGALDTRHGRRGTHPVRRLRRHRAHTAPQRPGLAHRGGNRVDAGMGD